MYSPINGCDLDCLRIERTPTGRVVVVCRKCLADYRDAIGGFQAIANKFPSGGQEHALPTDQSKG